MVAIFNVETRKICNVGEKGTSTHSSIIAKKKENTESVWLGTAVFGCAAAIIFISRNIVVYCEHNYDWVTPSCVIYNLTFMGCASTSVICMTYVIRLSSQPWRIFLRVVKERRIIYIFFLLVVLCYVDNSLGPNAPGIRPDSYSVVYFV